MRKFLDWFWENEDDDVELDEDDIEWLNALTHEERIAWGLDGYVETSDQWLDGMDRTLMEIEALEVVNA